MYTEQKHGVCPVCGKVFPLIHAPKWPLEHGKIARHGVAGHQLDCAGSFAEPTEVVTKRVYEEP